MSTSAMDTGLMRLAWTVLEEGVPGSGRNLSAGDRIQAVIAEIENRAILSPQERQQIHSYLNSRQPLIQSVIYE